MTPQPRQPNARTLMRIDAALARPGARRDRVWYACQQAERAGMLARFGYLDEARAALETIRVEFASRLDIAVSAQVCIAESFVAHFTNMSGLALDRMRRAHALSAAAGLTPVQALSAAWLGCYELGIGTGDSLRAARHLEEALQLAEPDDHASRTRACMTVAIELHFAERLDLAQVWYVRARHHATLLGDEATLSALSYTMAFYRAQHAIQSSLFDDHSGHDGADRYALASLDTTSNLDEHTRTMALDALVPLLRAALFTFKGLTVAALALYESNLGAAERQGLGRMMANFRVDMAWCRLRNGDAEGAAREAVGAEACFTTTAHTDDRAMAHARLAMVYAELCDTAGRLRHEPLARECWQRHRSKQAEIMAALEPIVARTPTRA